MLRLVLAVLLTGIVFAQTGCNAMRESSRQMVNALKPGDYDDGTDDYSDPWVRQAGIEARGNRPLESVGEPAAFHNSLTSPKAREIERSLGYDVQ